MSPQDARADPSERAAIERRLADARDELARFHVASLELFGSSVRGETRLDSDIDLLVTFDQPVDLLTFLELEEVLERLLGCDVDLVPRDSLKPLLKGPVLSEAVRVF